MEERLTEVIDYYTEAIAHVERQQMPAVGPSVDRRTFNLLTSACNDRTVCSRMCIVCRQVKTDTAADVVHEKIPQFYRGTAITRVKGSWIVNLFHHNNASFNLNLDYATFMQRYAESYGDDAGPLAGCTELRSDDWV